MSLLNAVVGGTFVIHADVYIVMKPNIAVNSQAEMNAGRKLRKSGARSRLAHIERMPVDDTSRPPKKSERCGGLTIASTLTSKP